MATSTYLIALGSNRPGRHGRPEQELRAALTAIGGVRRASRIIVTAPLGPSIRRFANACALIASDESPPRLLERLKGIERAFGRRPGRRWGARVIDLDIVLWSGGVWRARDLVIPHPSYAKRLFMLGPAAEIAPDWRDPVSGSALRWLRQARGRRRPIRP